MFHVSKRLVVTVLGIVIATAQASGQYRDGCAVDFGTYYLPFITANDISLPLYRFPSKKSAPFARFTSTLAQVSRYTHIPKFSLEHHGKESVEDMGKRIIDLSEASEYALPILAFSPDSEWVRVSLDCRIPANPPAAWLSIDDAKSAGMRIASWIHYFQPHSNVVFLCDSVSAFFTYPDPKFRIVQKGSVNSKQRSRIMEVLTYSDPWMMVRVAPPVTDKDTLWIQYLDVKGRPRIWPVEE